LASAPEYYDVTVGKIQDFGNDTRDFELRFEPGKRMPFIAGQFVSVVLPKDKVTPPSAAGPKGPLSSKGAASPPAAGGGVIRRAYSIASPPEQRECLNLIIKLVQGGVVTAWFWTLKPGDRFKVHGPFGKFILPDRLDFEPVFIATGTGIAPFRSMIHSLLRGGYGGKLSLIFGTRYDTMIPYHREWLDFAARHPNFTYIPTISRPGPEWKGETGYAQAKAEKFLSNPAGKKVYICGLNEMIQAVQEACLKAGFRKDQISYEKYD